MRLFLLFVALVFISATKSDYKILKENPHVSSQERRAVKIGLMPLEHPIRPILNSIFSPSRAMASVAALRKAGFKILKIQPRSYILVVRHPRMPGYLIKLYLDSESREKKGHPGWYWFMKRILGRNSLARCIEKNEIKRIKVPGKWIYPLPHSTRNHFVLVVEDMNLLSSRENILAWKNNVTKELLDELYTIIRKCGGSSLRPSNIPFCKNGKIAFIDTEYPGAKPDYVSIRPYLSPAMRSYWDTLTK